MTNSREVMAYIVAHLAGSMLSHLVIFFGLFVVIQAGVFFLFLAIRGRRASG